jgi:HSP20 family molecular chaperone IbpA
VLTVVIALPGVELDQVKVTLSAGMLHGHFERRIELSPIRFEMSSRKFSSMSA